MPAPPDRGSTSAANPPRARAPHGPGHTPSPPCSPPKRRHRSTGAPLRKGHTRPELLRPLLLGGPDLRGGSPHSTPGLVSSPTTPLQPSATEPSCGCTQTPQGHSEPPPPPPARREPRGGAAHNGGGHHPKNATVRSVRPAPTHPDDAPTDSTPTRDAPPTPPVPDPTPPDHPPSPTAPALPTPQTSGLVHRYPCSGR